jgi:hypothetical protein
MCLQLSFNGCQCPDNRCILLDSTWFGTSEGTNTALRVQQVCQ